MDYRPQGYNPYNPYAAVARPAAAKTALLKKVYGLLTASVLFSAAGAMFALYGGASMSEVKLGGVAVPPLVYFMAQHWIVGLLLMLGSVLGASAVRQRPGINVAALFGMATVIGVVIAPAIFIAQLSAAGGQALTGNPVRDAFILALAGFSGLSTYALATKKDFSYLGGALTMGLFVVIGAGILSFFVGGFQLQMAVACVTVLLFGGFVLYDTSRLMQRGEDDPVGFTIALYLDFLNLFLALLRILGGRRQ